MDLTAENTSESGSTHFNFHRINLSGLMLKMLKQEWPITLNVTPEVRTLVLVHEVPHSIESWSRSLRMRKCNHVMAVLSKYTNSLFLYKDYGRVLGTSKQTVNPPTSLPIRIWKQRNAVPWCFPDVLADPFWHRNHWSSHPCSRKYGVSGW